MDNFIYLDNAATTKPFAELSKIYEDYSSNFYNPSAVYNPAVNVKVLIEDTRRSICKALGGEQGNIIFTSGATEANNIALSSINLRGKYNLIVSLVDHPAVFNKAKQLQNAGENIIYAPTDNNGTVRLNDIKNLVSDKTVMVSIMHVNNETGAINDIKQICDVIKSINPKTVIHVDGVQAVGKIKVDLQSLGVDMYTISAHKINGPKGIGALWVKKGIKINPIVYGGGQEQGYRSGTENVFGILSLGYCIGKVVAEQEQNYNKIQLIKNAFLQQLTLNNVQFKLNSGNNCSPYIISLSFNNVRGEVLLHNLESHNILISTGSACSSRKPDNRTLKAMGLNDNLIMGSIRISFSAYDNYDVNNIADTIATEVKNLQKIIRGNNG